MRGRRMVERVIGNPWRTLRRFTDARIGMGRAGVSLPTAELLAFQMAHAQARDAVHQPLDVARLVNDLALVARALPAVCVQSQAVDRADYLRHPDKGRRLAQGAVLPADAPELALVIADGLSSRAVQDHAAAVVSALIAQLPGPGLTDARRNCISNVRPAGLLPERSAARFAYLYAQAQVLGTSGVALKDNSAALDALGDAAATSFLTPPIKA